MTQKTSLISQARFTYDKQNLNPGDPFLATEKDTIVLVYAKKAIIDYDRKEQKVEENKDIVIEIKTHKNPFSSELNKPSIKNKNRRNRA